MNDQIWVIGDIHGMYDPLKRLLSRIRHYDGQSIQSTRLIFLGDYIDYGPCSREVIDLLIETAAEFKTTFLAGNHEDLLLQFLLKGDLYDEYGNVWFNGNGGQDTIYSFMPTNAALNAVYGGHSEYHSITPEEFKLSKKYTDFFKRLKYAHTEQLKYRNQTADFAFCHSIPINPGNGGIEKALAIEDQLSTNNYREFHKLRKDNDVWIEDMHVWSRRELSSKLGKYVIVHGHTPTSILDHYYHRLGNYHLNSRVPFVQTTRDDLHVTQEYREYNIGVDFGKEVIALNVDTGAAYGMALSAIRLDARALLRDRRIEVLQVHLDRPTRHHDDVMHYSLKFRA